MNKYDATKFFDKTQYILEKKKREDLSHVMFLKKGVLKANSFPVIYGEKYTDSLKGIDKFII